MNKVTNTIKNLYSDVESISGEELISTINNDFGVELMDIAQALANMKATGEITLEGNGLGIKDKTIVFNREVITEISTPTSPTTLGVPAQPVKSSPKVNFGFDIQVDRNGRSYKRKRTAFDGPKIELPEKYEQMKSYFQKYSLELREQIVEFNGAGEYAIAILNEDPALAKFEDRNGNIYHRWNAENVIPVMEKYWANVQLLIQEDKVREAEEGEGE